MSCFRRAALLVSLLYLVPCYAIAQQPPTQFPRTESIPRPPATSPRPGASSPLPNPGTVISPGPVVTQPAPIVGASPLFTQPAPSPGIGSSAVVHPRIVYRNDHGHFQLFYPPSPRPPHFTAYFTLWHRVPDPHNGCETLVAKTYLSELAPLRGSDPVHYDYWTNLDQQPHAIDWRIHKQSCDGCHFQIDYRRPETVNPSAPDEGWRCYGLFERDLPQ
jgi:hypothetical protein